MAAYFIDLDGVFFRYGTMTPTDGAVQSVKQLWMQGHQIFFTTRRTAEGNKPPELNLDETRAKLSELGVRYTGIVSGVESPRILINDEGAHAINHRRNKPLRIASDLRFAHAVYCTDTIPISTAIRDLTEKIHDILVAIAWTAWTYTSVLDADDYIQTVQVARSLCASGGFNHSDLVARYRCREGITFNGAPLYYGGIAKDYKGQVAKLLASSDSLYVAADGASDGSAMKVAGIAAFYCNDFEQMVLVTDAITRVTHASIESRLAAVLTAIRIQQTLVVQNDQDIGDFVMRFREAIALLNFKQKAEFFLRRVEKAAEITTSEHKAIVLLIKLAQEIGLTHLAWGTPIAACFWSFRANNDFKKWLALCLGEKSIVFPAIDLDHVYLPIPEGSRIPVISRLIDFRMITASILNRNIVDEDQRHLLEIGEYESFMASHGHHWNRSLDSDTFFSIAISILAGRYGIESILDEVPQAVQAFGDNLRGLATQLASRASTSDRSSTTSASQIA